MRPYLFLAALLLLASCAPTMQEAYSKCRQDAAGGLYGPGVTPDQAHQLCLQMASEAASERHERAQRFTAAMAGLAAQPAAPRQTSMHDAMMPCEVAAGASMCRDTVVMEPAWPFVLAPTREEALWGLSPDWWVAIFTAGLTVATVALGIFTALLWKATRKAVKDTEGALTVARDTALAARQQAEVAERVGMIQNVNALHGHLRYAASCVLFDRRPSEGLLRDVPAARKGFGRLLERLEHGHDVHLRLGGYGEDHGGTRALQEVAWPVIILSPFLREFFTTAQGIWDIASGARVEFLVDARIPKILKMASMLNDWEVEARWRHENPYGRYPPRAAGLDKAESSEH